MEGTGLRREDPRLKVLIQNLEEFLNEHDDDTVDADDLQKLVIGRKEFKRSVEQAGNAKNVDNLDYIKRSQFYAYSGYWVREAY